MGRGTGATPLFRAPHWAHPNQGNDRSPGVSACQMILNTPVKVLDMTGRPESFPALSEGSRAALVRLLVHGPASRADLARRLRLSAASLTRIIRSLEDSGLVVEAETVVPQRMGRPSQAMDVNVDAVHLIGIKLLAGEINLVRTDMRSTVLAHRTIPLQTEPVQAAIDQIADAVSPRWPSIHWLRPSASAWPGRSTPSPEVVTQSPFLGWENVPVGRLHPGTDRAAHRHRERRPCAHRRRTLVRRGRRGHRTSPWSPSVPALGAES